VTGRPPEVTVTTADAAENCGTLAEGTKLSVVTVAGGLPAKIAVLARSISTAGRRIEIEINEFIISPRFLNSLRARVTKLLRVLQEQGFERLDDLKRR
jgi:hypothetical protein